MLNENEKKLLAQYKEMATMNSEQALEYHSLLVKEADVPKEEVVEIKVESKKKGHK